MLPSDYTGQLTQLLRYPELSTDIDPSASHHATLLLKQALFFQTSPNPSSGATIVIENRNLLNIPIDVPEPALVKKQPRSPDRLKNNSATGPSSLRRSRRDDTGVAPSQMGLPEMFARGLLEKGESLGINRTVMNAVSELRVRSTILTWILRN